MNETAGFSEKSCSNGANYYVL